MIRIEQVSKSFGGAPGVQVLRNLSFTVKAGELVALVGPNGCGKTTLLRLIAGLTTPDTGKISIDYDSQTSAAVIGFMPQRYRESLFPWRTVRDNLHLPFEGERAPDTVSPAPYIEEAVQHMGVAHLLSRRPHTLSGGQMQLVALARSFVTPWTRVLLLDEPFSALDGANLARAAAAIARIAADRRAAVLFITHDIDVSMLIARRIVILRTGVAGVVDDVVSPGSGRFRVSDLASMEFAACKARILSALFPEVTAS